MSIQRYPRYLGLNETEVQTIRHGLEVAAARFKLDAEECRKIPGHDRIADQFERQQKETLELAERIEAHPLTR